MGPDFSEEALLHIDPASETLRLQMQQAGRKEAAALARAMRSHNPLVSKAAVEVALLLPEPYRFQALGLALRARSPVVGGYAVSALEAYGDTAVPALLAALNDSHVLVAMWIVVALGEIGSRQSVLPLLETLNQAASPTLRCTIIKALGQIGDSDQPPSRHLQTSQSAGLFCLFLFPA